MYLTSSGRRFVLAYHSLSDWAEATESALLYLRCSPEYAAAARDEIATAQRVESEAKVR